MRVSFNPNYNCSGPKNNTKVSQNPSFEKVNQVLVKKVLEETDNLNGCFQFFLVDKRVPKQDKIDTLNAVIEGLRKIFGQSSVDALQSRVRYVNSLPD